MHAKSIVQFIMLFFAVAVILAVAVPVVKSRNDCRKAQKFADSQGTYLEDLQEMTDTIDDTVSLYLSDKMSEEEYRSCITSLASEYAILQADYDSHDTEDIYLLSKADQKKTACVENCYQEIGTLMDICINPEVYEDKERLSYLYLAAGQSVGTYIAGYMEAIEERGE